MRKAYFEDGTILETYGGKAHFKQAVAAHRDYWRLTNGKRPRVWFRPCKEWDAAATKELGFFEENIG